MISTKVSISTLSICCQRRRFTRQTLAGPAKQQLIVEKDRILFPPPEIDATNTNANKPVGAVNFNNVNSATTVNKEPAVSTRPSRPHSTTTKRPAPPGQLVSKKPTNSNNKTTKKPAPTRKPTNRPNTGGSQVGQDGNFHPNPTEKNMTSAGPATHVIIMPPRLCPEGYYKDPKGECVQGFQISGRRR
jgi:hypothetical protein